MKLIKQTELIFQGGTSDKVYEVDLCEVGPNQYVVNFRYGRRGSTLKEGTKTALPVAHAKAEQVFDKLVASKVKKGYLDTQTPQPVTPLPEIASVEPLASRDDPREEAVLARLQMGDAQPAAAASRGILSRKRRQKPQKTWPLNRAIWRASELGIQDAEPLLLNFLTATDHVRNYSVIHALAHCGTAQSLPHLQRVHETAGFPDHVRQLAAAVLFILLPVGDRETLREQLLGSLPPTVSDAARRGPSRELEGALEAHLAQVTPVAHAVLPTLYLIDNMHTRPVVLDWLRRSSLRPPKVKPLRQIFKLAELRRDSAVFGLIAYRFETTSAMFRYTSWGEAYIPQLSRGYLDTDEVRRELSANQAKIGFSEKTRQYFRRRIWRTLRRLGELGSPDYVAMATDVLLMYDDRDARAPRMIYVTRKKQSTHRRGRSDYTTHRVQCDAYSHLWAFNQILYRHSSRYCQATQTWYCHESYKPGDPAPDAREEAFPELWQEAPVHLLRLLRESHCRPVHEFAVKALRGCPEFCASLDRDVLLAWLDSAYDCTAQFAFELVEDRFDASQPDLELVYAALASRSALARERALIWLQSLSETDVQSLLQRLFTYILSLDENASERAEGLATTLLANAGTRLGVLELSTVQLLIQHPLEVLQQLGGEILLRHHEHAPFELIELLLNAPSASLRELGIRLMAQLPDAELARHRELVVVLASHAESEMRAAATPSLRRLKSQQGEALTELFIVRLLNPKLPEGVPSHILQLLRTEFQSYFGCIDSGLTWRLLRASHTPAHELGGLLLEHHADPESLSVKQMVALADHDVLSVRQAARTLCRQNLARLQQEMAETVKLLDAKWDDSRTFAFAFFTEHMGPDELRPDILVSICDSVREDVQQFGRHCIVQYFQEADGQDYMLKLSEHPSADMQQFVTNYLERYAADDPQRLQQLTPYLHRALSLVNRGRTTKQRLYRFLSQEALKSPAAAQIVADILAHQAATIAVGDRAAAIRILLRLQLAHPAIATPLQRREAILR